MLLGKPKSVLYYNADRIGYKRAYSRIKKNLCMFGVTVLVIRFSRTNCFISHLTVVIDIASLFNRSAESYTNSFRGLQTFAR